LFKEKYNIGKKTGERNFREQILTKNIITFYMLRIIKNIKIMSLIIPVLVFFLNTSPSIKAEADVYGEQEYSIYLIKQRWHTGFVIEREKIDTTIFPEINDFKNFKWVDIGWGDADFYPHPDPGAEEIAYALFVRTPSVLRIEGFNMSIERYIEFSDLAAGINLSKKEFDQLSLFIHNTYKRDGSGNTIINHRQYQGNVLFYAAEGNYHLLNTCNTWIAKALDHIGINISKNIVLAEQLFKDAKKFGTILKGE
jgi:uncharacterized protein (TIGR02117 family)